MEDAKKLFSTMALHDLTSWSTIISGFVHNGLGEEATDFFDQFKQTGDKPDPRMFTHVFLSCGILGSVDEGMLHFESMQMDFGITPAMDHYASIVNMLGQSGYLDEAREFVERMPMEPSIDVWESLMNMCRLNGSRELGDRCTQIIERLDPSRLNEQSKMGLFPVNASDLAKEKERKKANSVEARSKVHEYRAGDRSHPETLKIYEELRYLAAHMKEAGYVADTRFVLHDVDPETKEDALLAHSERLAVSYGLITSAARAPIRVIKNLRSCGDCHTALKIISKLVGRQIIARDAKRFHHFENGVCSCKDYW
jgi:pentatricopeptide repeat protein